MKRPLTQEQIDRRKEHYSKRNAAIKERRIRIQRQNMLKIFSTEELEEEFMKRKQQDNDTKND